MSNTKTSDEILAEALKQQEAPVVETPAEPVPVSTPDPIPDPTPAPVQTTAPTTPIPATFVKEGKKKIYGKFIS